MNKKISIPIILTVALLMFFIPSALAANTVTVTAPNGGELWDGTNSITWTNTTCKPADTDNFTIEYSYDGGPYTAIVSNTTYSGGSYSWDTSARMDGVQYLIRVRKSNASGTVNDVSDAFFTLDNTPGSHYYEEPTPSPEPLIATPSTMVESLKSPLGIILVVAVLALGYLLWKKK